MKPDNTTISQESIDAVRELITIGVGRAAAMLNDLTHSHIHLEVPSAKIISLANLMQEPGYSSHTEYATVTLSFDGVFSGTTALIMLKKPAAVLVSALAGEKGHVHDLDLVRAETLVEVGNIIINGVMGSIGNAVSEPLTYGLPKYSEGGVNAVINRGRYNPGTYVIIAMTRFTIQDLSVSGEILIVLGIESLLALIEKTREFASHSIRE
jgi:chemotaxis protein CheC